MKKSSFVARDPGAFCSVQLVLRAIPSSIFTPHAGKFVGKVRVAKKRGNSRYSKQLEKRRSGASSGGKPQTTFRRMNCSVQEAIVRKIASSEVYTHFKFVFLFRVISERPEQQKSEIEKVDYSFSQHQFQRSLQGVGGGWNLMRYQRLDIGLRAIDRSYSVHSRDF